MVKIIILSSGRECLVDDEDYELLAKNKWADDRRGYAIRAVRKDDGTRTTVKMHRLLLNAKPGEIVDHINGNPSDNRKSNLRIVSDAANARNSRKYSTNTTGYKGVAPHTKGRFTAQITVNYRKIHLGVFEDKVEAARAYNVAAVKYFGKYAKLNEIKEDSA